MTSGTECAEKSLSIENGLFSSTKQMAKAGRKLLCGGGGGGWHGSPFAQPPPLPLLGHRAGRGVWAGAALPAVPGGGGGHGSPFAQPPPSPSLVAMPGGGFGLGLPYLPCPGGGGGMAWKPICPTPPPSPSLVAVPGGGVWAGAALPAVPPGGGGGPTCMPQNDPHVALIILTTHMWGKFWSEKKFSGPKFVFRRL